MNNDNDDNRDNNETDDNEQRCFHEHFLTMFSKSLQVMISNACG